MNTKHTIPSDEDLTAFIDGELTAEEAARIEALITEDEGVAERLEFLARANLPFAQAFAPLLSEAPREKLERMLAAIPEQKSAKSASVPPVATRRRFLGALAASLVAGIAIDRAVIGIGIGRGFSAKDENSEWRAVVAEYISLYTPETLTGPVPGRKSKPPNSPASTKSSAYRSPRKPSHFPASISNARCCCNMTVNRSPRSPISTLKPARWRSASSCRMRGPMRRTSKTARV